MSAPLVLGTAGHVDHGKTTLVQALTGTWADRLPEERARGLTIALGYALLELPSGRRLSVVDVPGHERFVRTMVAGATGIDLFVLVVAADDGVMPQTLEHLAVLRALGVRDGVVAITKADVADPTQAAADVRELLGDVEIVACDARTGRGTDALVAALDRVATSLEPRGGRPGPPVLHIDRSFTVEGRGTVVTGTLWSGTVHEGDRLTVLPRGTAVRVRGLEVHGSDGRDGRCGPARGGEPRGRAQPRRRARRRAERRRRRRSRRRCSTACWTCTTRSTAGASKCTTGRATARHGWRTCARISGSCAWRSPSSPATATTS